MKQYLFAVYDVKANAFNAPIALLSKAAAIRSFTDAVTDKSTPFGRHPEDYSLFLVGEWDELTGTIIAAKANERIITALECFPDAGEAKLQAVK